MELVDAKGNRINVGEIDVNQHDTFDSMEAEAVKIGEAGKKLLLEKGIKKNSKFWWQQLWRKIARYFVTATTQLKSKDLPTLNKSNGKSCGSGNKEN